MKHLLPLAALFFCITCARIIKDDDSEFRTSLVRMKNHGGSHKDIKKSYGDLLEATFYLVNGNVTFIGHKRTLKTQPDTFTIIANNVTITKEDLNGLNAELKDLAVRQSKNPRVQFVVKMLEFLTYARPGFVLSSKTVTRDAEAEEEGEIVKRTAAEKLLLLLRSRRFNRYYRRQYSQPFQKNCNSYILNNWASDPFAGKSSYTCPTFSSKAVTDSWTCLCPWNGFVSKEALYTSKDGITISWLLSYGAASPDCLGRCGRGCGFADTSAWQDCFNHDVCLTHFGGPALVSWLLEPNVHCDDELSRASDDYWWGYAYSCGC